MLSSCKKFYFIRHGETNFNKEKKYTGTFDILLNKQGFKQVKNAVEILLLQNITVIYTSPLKRALQTAIIISNKLNIPIVVVDEFIERDFGILQTKKKLRYKKKYFYKAPTMYQHRRKTIIGFNKIKKHNSLIVGHSGTYKALMNYLLKTNISESINNANIICFVQHNNKQWKTIDLCTTKPSNEH